MAERVVLANSQHQPAYVVWELTLRCDLACRHCGSRAGSPREAELDVATALGVVSQLAALGTREITFIGGEAYLFSGWLEVVRAATDAGIRCTMTTGGRAVTAAMAEAAAAAGLKGMSVSIDGLAPTHDRLRAVPGSHRSALATLQHAREAGLQTYANTQFNRLNLPEVEALAALLLDCGIRAWQVQLTGPMGRAADQPDWLLQPFEILDLVPRLAQAAATMRARGCEIQAANNLGYYGRYDRLIRPAPWQGCAAGLWVLGIEADGSVKGCPSLPSAPYVGGNVRDTPLRQIWEESVPLRFARERTPDELWGYCARCYYAPLCKGGCSWTAHTLLGRRGNMPYCFHRAEQLQAEGIRERIVKVADAPGTPFDFGRFALVEEPIPSEQAPGPAPE